jgi:hypothetical protein
MLEYDEKRDYIRMDVDCKVTYKLIDSDEVKTGRCLSLSGSGVSFVAESSFDVGLAMEVNVLPENPVTPSMTAYIEVVRSIAQEEGTFEIAGIIKSLK